MLLHTRFTDSMLLQCCYTFAAISDCRGFRDVPFSVIHTSPSLTFTVIVTSCIVKHIRIFDFIFQQSEFGNIRYLLLIQAS